jgi:hypothetical protein
MSFIAAIVTVYIVFAAILLRLIISFVAIRARISTTIWMRFSIGGAFMTIRRAPSGAPTPINAVITTTTTTTTTTGVRIRDHSNRTNGKIMLGKARVSIGLTKARAFPIAGMSIRVSITGEKSAIT